MKSAILPLLVFGLWGCTSDLSEVNTGTTKSRPIPICGSGPRITCVVDGDTFWLNGEKVRLEGIDTPETTNGVCGGEAERRLGRVATARLAEILGDGDLSVSRSGFDRFGRTLATATVNGRDVGAILVSERLARNWPDGNEFWCR